MYREWFFCVVQFDFFFLLALTLTLLAFLQGMGSVAAVACVLARHV